MKKPTKKQIETILAKIQQSVSEIPFLNRGGCGVFAALVGHRLEKLGVNCRIRIADDNAADSKDNLTKFLEKNNNNVSSKRDLDNAGVLCGHLIVEFDLRGKTYHFDSCFFHEAKERSSTLNMPFYRGFLTVAQAMKVAKSRNWNYMFSRKNIPQMIRSLNSAVKI